jgi:Transaldolase/Fructose-6-phosphate aldolase
VLRPLHDRSGGGDGFVSVELAPALAHDTEASVAAARTLHRRIGAPSLLVKIPATAEGVAAVRQATAEGLSINVTLLFGLDRYEQVIEAYLQGLEAHPGDLSRVHSVASFGETFTSPRSLALLLGNYGCHGCSRRAPVGRALGAEQPLARVRHSFLQVADLRKVLVGPGQPGAAGDDGDRERDGQGAPDQHCRSC